MKEQNKYLSIGIVVVVIALLIIFVMKRPGPSSDSINDTVGIQEEVPDKAGVAPSKPVPSSKTPQTLSREEALALYEVIRITDSCLAESHGYTFNLTEGTVIMIDNDGKVPHTVVLPSRTVTLSPQHYTLETLPSGGAVSSTCNEKTKITTIVVK